MNLIRLQIRCLILATCLCPAQMVRAELIIGSTPGTIYFADSYSTFNTTSTDMVGMRVTVEFQNGQTETQTWTATGINGTGWNMDVDPGSTFSVPFTITNQRSSRMTRFTMRGANSRTIFDRSVASSTAGTGNGRDLQEFTFLRFSQDINVNYFDQVQTIGSPGPVGDIYAGMDVAFSVGINQNTSFVFRTDTDTTLNAITSSIPEPASGVTFAIAIASMCARRRRVAG